ncbi:MAG: type I-E CRISPR-associated protein Cse2/CasB [Verrucomicrobiae bacterium]|nr:type I-E CRISPR-associated protein Cse2/CasB [Verrucomicrobiae bacterium]
MSNNQPDPKEIAAKVLAYLRQLRHDRGAMADLRCALNPAKRARAWPLLAPVGGIDRPVYETIAGLYAYHPVETDSGNLGTTCRGLAGENTSFESRFKRLLSCDRDEICERIRPVILAARAKGIPVNYEELFADLCYWGDTVKARWAREFWGAPVETQETMP